MYYPMLSPLNIGYQNIHGYSNVKWRYLRECVKHPRDFKSGLLKNAVRPDPKLDLLCIAETWHVDSLHGHRSDLFVASTPFQKRLPNMGRGHGGLVLLASPAIRPYLGTPVISKYFISVVFKKDNVCLVISFVYFPPHLIDPDLNRLLANELPKSDIIMGDTNIHYGSLFNDHRSGPPGRLSIMGNYCAMSHLKHLRPSSGHTTIDHVFCSLRVKPLPSFLVHSQPADITDHPMITLSVPLPTLPTIEGHPCPERFLVKFLEHPLARLMLHENYQNVALEMLPRSDTAALIEEVAMADINDRQPLVDCLDMQILSLSQSCCDEVLGSYTVDAIQQYPDSTFHSVQDQVDISSVDALKLFKRAQRTDRHESSLVSRDLSKSPLQDAVAFFEDTFSAHTEQNSEETLILDLVLTRLHGFGNQEEELAFPSLKVGKLYSDLSISETIRKYPLGKSPGLDSMDMSILKVLSDEKITDRPMNQVLFLHHMERLFNLCLALGVTPRRWNENVIYPIPKNSGKKNVNNTIDQRRPISLTPAFRRIFERILLDYLVGQQNIGKLKSFHPSQAGFRSGFSSTSLALLSDACSRNGYKHKVFLDLKQAYDRVPLHLLWSKLIDFKCPLKIVRVLRALFEGGTCRIVVNGRLSDPVVRQRGLLQGSVLSPWLFNVFINDLAEEINSSATCKGQAFPVGLFFADDIQIQSKDEHVVRSALDLVVSWAEKNRMEINVLKCGQFDTGNRLFVRDQALPVVETYSYLGFPHNVHGIDWTRHLANCLVKAQGVFYTLKKHFYTDLYAEKIKLELYKAFSRVMLDYGGALSYASLFTRKKLHGISAIQKDIKKDLEKFEKDVLVWIFGSSSPRKVLLSMTALGTLERRLDELACRFALKLDNAHPDNPVNRIICESGKKAHPLVQKIQGNKLKLRFQEEWESKAAVGERPVPLDVFLLRDRLREISKKSKMAETISASARSPGGTDKGAFRYRSSCPRSRDPTQTQCPRHWYAMPYLLKTFSSKAPC